MAIYSPARGEYARMKMRRVNALRSLATTGAISFHRYVWNESAPTYEVSNAEGAPRPLDGSEVPAYLLGGHDVMIAVRQHMPDIIDTAFASPEVVDRESLAEAILAELEARYTGLGEAVAQFPQPEQGSDLTVAS